MKTLIRNTRWLAGILLAGGLLIGCTPTPKAQLAEVSCRFSFNGLDASSDRERVERVIHKYAREDSIQVTDSDSSSPKYTFRVKRFAVLDELQNELVFENGSSWSAKQVLNPHEPLLAIHYDAPNLDARMEVIVKFITTPGATLFYKPQGEPEKDITADVSESGHVALHTMIRKGEDFIYARTVSGNVDRYVRINVFTQEVREISQSQYPH